MRTLSIVFYTVIATCGFFLIAIAAVVFAIRRIKRKEFKADIDSLLTGLNFVFCWLRMYASWGLFSIRQYAPVFMTVLFLIAGYFTLVELLLKGAALPAAVKLKVLIPNGLQDAVHNLLLKSNELVEHLLQHEAFLVSLFIVELLLVIHHLFERKHRNREREMLSLVADIMGPLTQVRSYLNRLQQVVSDPAHREHLRRAAMETFFSYFAKSFGEMMSKHSVTGVHFGVMEPGPQADLVTMMESSNQQLVRKGFALGPGTGAAGKAFSSGKVIYVPNVRFEHGFVVDSRIREITERVWIPSPHPFKSIICAPICKPAETLEGLMASHGDERYIHAGSEGVLNLSSLNPSAFGVHEFTVAKLGAAILTLVYT